MVRTVPYPATHATERLMLRRPDRGDGPFMTDLFAQPLLVAHRPVPRPDPPAVSAARLAREMAHWDGHGFSRWIALAGGLPVGLGGVTRSDRFDALNLSYHLHPAAWGHGYATEMALAAIDQARRHLAATAIVGLARPANPASQRVLERCGFRFAREVDHHGAPTRLYVLDPLPDGAAATRE